MSEQSRERLKMPVNIPAGWSTQFLRTQPGTPTGPVAFHGFSPRKADLISAIVTVRTGTHKSVGLYGFKCTSNILQYVYSLRF